MGIGGKEDPFNGHEYVDLGLPSGTLWATKNVGAEAVGADGHFFTFGSTVPHTANSVIKYAIYDTDNNIIGWSKYNSEDGLLQLQPEDDPATVIMGGKWSLPTVEQVTELVNNVTCAKINNYFSNRSVCECTSTINGNKLILPLSGVFGDIYVQWVNDYCFWRTNTLINHNVIGDNNKILRSNQGTVIAVGQMRRNWGSVVRGVININS